MASLAKKGGRRRPTKRRPTRPREGFANACSNGPQQERLNGVEEVLRTHFYRPDVQGVRAVYAAVAAHRLSGQPVWPMLVAPPGSLKTETLDALQGLPKVHFIDSVTPNTFISGQIQEGKKRGLPPSLLDRLGKSAILVYADFGTVLGMNRERRGSVLADMRRIYDGRLRKEFGTSEPVPEWQGRITFAVAATPDVDRYHSIFQTLGERFVMIRSHRPGGVDAALQAMNQDVRRVKEELRQAVHDLFAGIPGDVTDVDVARDFQLQIAALAEVAVRARTHVARDRSKDIIYNPEPEAPTRLAQQLCQLAKGSALLIGRRAVEAEDLALVRRVAFDCIPATRREILEDCIGTERGGQSGKLSAPEATLSYAREDLRSVGLLTVTTLSELARELLAQAGVLPLFTKRPPLARKGKPNRQEGEHLVKPARKRGLPAQEDRIWPRAGDLGGLCEGPTKRKPVSFRLEDAWGGTVGYEGRTGPAAQRE